MLVGWLECRNNFRQVGYLFRHLFLPFARPYRFFKKVLDFHGRVVRLGLEVLMETVFLDMTEEEVDQLVADLKLELEEFFNDHQESNKESSSFYDPNFGNGFI
jgi:hypothetical protein